MSLFVVAFWLVFMPVSFFAIYQEWEEYELCTLMLTALLVPPVWGVLELGAWLLSLVGLI